MSQPKEDATSRPSSTESEKTVSSASSTASVISETAGKVVSETLERAAANIGELMQSMSRWEAEAGDSADQKLERHLQRFFSLRRVFAESQRETEEDEVPYTETSGPAGHHVPNTISAQKSYDSDGTVKKSERKHRSKIYNKMKSAWKQCFRWKPRRKLAEENDLDETAGSEGSDSKSSSPEETSPTPSIGSREDIVASEKEDLDATHGSSLVLPEAERVDEVIGSVSSDLTSGCTSPAEKADLLVTNMDATHGPSLVLPGAENVDEVIESVSSDLTSGCTFPAEKADLLVTNMDTTRGPSLVLPGAEDVCETVSTQSCDSDRTDEKPDGKHGSKIFKKLKSALKGSFRWTPKKKVPLEAEQDLDETAGSENSDSKSGSPCLEETSSTASMCSTEDIRYAAKADLSSDPLELADDVEHKDITPETEKGPSTLSPTGSSQPAEHYEERSAVMEEDLVTNMDSQPGPSEQDGHLEPSQVHLGAEQNVDELKTASSDLTSDRVSPTKVSPTASIGSSEDIKAAEKADLSSVPLEDMDSQPGPSGQDGHLEPSQVHPGAEQNVDELKTTSSDLTSDRVSPTKVSPTASIGSSEDIKAAEKADLSSVPLEDMDSQPGPSGQDGHLEPSQVHLGAEQNVDEIETASSDLTSDRVSPTKVSPTASVGSSEDIKAAEKADLSSSPLGERSSVTDKDLVMYRDSTPGPSEQDGNLEDDNGAAAVAEITGLKNTFYKIIKGFFDSLTKEQRREISEGVYNSDVNDKLADMCVELLKLVIETITDVLSKAIYQSAPPYSTLSTKSPTFPQICGTEAVGHKLLTELLREEDNISHSLKGSLGKAFCDVVGADTSISISPKFTEAIVRAITDEIKSVLSETVQASLDGSSIAHAVTCCQLSSCATCKEIFARVIWAKKCFLTALGTAKKKTVHKETSPWWSCFHKVRKNKVHPLPDLQVKGAVKASSSTLSSGHQNSLSPRARSRSIRSQTSPSPETQTEMRSSSCHQSGDSADINCQTDVEEFVMADSDTDVTEKKEDSTPHQAVRTKGPSRLKRIWLFCCKLNCCCCQNV